MGESDLADASELEQLRQQWSTITETPDRPRSTMDVIEFGLGRQQQAEVYINRLLCYFLDPTNPHGMGDDFLASFLSGLPEAVKFDEDTYDLETVRVNQQVHIDDDDSTGYADLLLDVPDEWLLLVELKFSAPETGTKFYAEASSIGGEPVDSYGSGKYYLYLHQSGKPTARSSDFENWTWSSFINDVLDDVIRDNAPRYPQRTTTQLHDLRDDLKTITNMNDEQTSDQEKVELYLEHVEAIEDVTSAFDDAWDSFSTRWDSRLATSLEEDASIDVHQTTDREFPVVTVPRTDATTEEWLLRATGGDWQHLTRYGWYRHQDTLEPLTGRAEDRRDLRIGFYFRMERYRTEAVQDHELRFNFRNMGSNPTAFKDIYQQKFDARKEEIRQHVANTEGTLTGNKLTTIKATYDIPVTQYGSFFEAYTAALQDAFVDFVVDNPELIRILSETYDDAVEEFSS